MTDSGAVNWTDNLDRDLVTLAKLTESVEVKSFERIAQLEAQFEMMKDEFPILQTFLPKVTLDVGGELFRTTVEILTKEESLFSSMFSGRMIVNADPDDGSYFVDRSPEFFKYILEYLRNGKIRHLKKIPKIDQKGICEDAKFYEIASLVELLGGNKVIPDDEWSSIHKSQNIALSNDNLTAKHISSGHCSVYGKNIIEEGEYEWRVRIDTINATSHWMAFGVIPSTVSNSYGSDYSSAYCISSSNQVYPSGTTTASGDYINGDVISIQLDLYKKTVKIQCERTKRFFTHTIPSGKYRLYLNLHNSNNGCTIVTD